MNSFLENESNLNEDNLIAYLNGLLAMLETFNDGPYTGNTFEFSKIANLQNDPVVSISTALGGHWTIEVSRLDDFYQHLDKTLNEYCQQYPWSIRDRIAKFTSVQPDDTIIQQILEATNHPNIKWNVSSALQLLLKENYIAYAVAVKGPGWYEASYKDYFFDCGGVYYFLHFGISD